MSQPRNHSHPPIRDADDDGIEQGEGTVLERGPTPLRIGGGEPVEILGSSADDICLHSSLVLGIIAWVFGGRSRLNITGQPYRALAIPIAPRR
jgi:hypothetical protein